MEFAIRQCNTGELARRVFDDEESTDLPTDLELSSFDRNSAIGGRTNTYRSTTKPITNYF
jgi:hypothetical protein